MYSAFGKSLCTYKSCWKWRPRASIQAWICLILFANIFCRSAFGKSLCTYKRCWKWGPRASIQAWTCLNLFANIFCRSAFEKSLCTYKMSWMWCPRALIQAWTVPRRSLSAERLSERTVLLVVSVDVVSNLLVASENNRHAKNAIAAATHR
jgi:hypothetical protein